MAVPYTFGAATAAIPLSQLDSNFASTITLGNTAIQLGNTVTILNNMTFANVTVSSGTVSVTTATATTANLVTINATTLNAATHRSDASLVLQTNGTTTAVTIDTAQNVGVGVTPSAWYTGSSWKVIDLPSAALRGGSQGAALYANAYVNSGLSNIYKNTGFYALAYQQQADTGAHVWFNAPSGTAGNAITFTQAMTLDASGNLLVGTTTAQGKLTTVQSANTDTGYLQNDSATLSNACNGLRVIYANASPNNTTASFFRTGDSTAVRAEIRSNGGLANFSANNVNLSDERTKTDIQNAGGYLAKICAIPVRTFKYKDQTDDLLNLGVIAQEVEAVAPELVDVSGFGETPEDGVPLKAIYQTDLQYALMKCIQEQQSLIQSLTDRLTALEGAAK